MQTSRLAILVPLHLLVVLAALAVFKLYLPTPKSLAECARDPRMEHTSKVVSSLMESGQYGRATEGMLSRCEELWKMDDR